jgi:hypothetical protein
MLSAVTAIPESAPPPRRLHSARVPHESTFLFASKAPAWREKLVPENGGAALMFKSADEAADPSRDIVSERPGQ